MFTPKSLLLFLSIAISACSSVLYTPRPKFEQTQIITPQMLCLNSLTVDSQDNNDQAIQHDIAISYLNDHGFLVTTLCDEKSIARRVDIRVSNTRYLLKENEEIKTLWNVHSIISFGMLPLFSEKTSRITVRNTSDDTLFFDQTYTTYGISSWWLLPTLPASGLVENSNESIKIRHGMYFINWKFGGITIAVPR